MAQEFFDHGARKAAFTLVGGNPAANAVCNSIGISQIQRQGAGEYRGTLVEPVGEEEFFAHGVAESSGVATPATVAVTWVTDTTFDVEVRDATGAALDGVKLYVAIYRLNGGSPTLVDGGGG